MRAKDIKEFLLSGEFDDLTVKEFANIIRKLESSTDEILNKIKDKEDETVKHDR